MVAPYPHCAASDDAATARGRWVTVPNPPGLHPQGVPILTYALPTFSSRNNLTIYADMPHKERRALPR